MTLTFSNRRTIPAGDYDDDAPWIRDVDLTPLDREQLLCVVRMFGPDVTEREMLEGNARFFATARSRSPKRRSRSGKSETA